MSSGNDRIYVRWYSFFFSVLFSDDLYVHRLTPPSLLFHFLSASSCIGFGLTTPTRSLPLFFVSVQFCTFVMNIPRLIDSLCSSTCMGLGGTPTPIVELPIRKFRGIQLTIGACYHRHHFNITVPLYTNV